MQRDRERIALVRQALIDAGLDALVCSLPSDVLLLSGYWPVVGTAIVIVTRDAGVAVVAPADEEELAATGWGTRFAASSRAR